MGYIVPDCAKLLRTPLAGPRYACYYLGLNHKSHCQWSK